MNLLTLVDGRFTEADEECLVDSKLVDNGVLAIGDTVTLRSGTDTETEDIIASDTFTVVGSVSSPIYMSLERGTTSIGNGTLDGFLVLDESVFSMDYYTSICLTVEGAAELQAYTDAYDELVDGIVEAIEEIADERCEIRYAQLQQEGQDAIADAEAEIADAQQELDDAEQELTDGRAELADGKQELADGWEEYYDGLEELTDAEQELADAKQEVADGWAEVESGRAQLADAEAELADGWEEYEDGYEEYEEGLTQYEAGYAEYEEGLAQYEAGYAEYEEGLAQYEAGYEVYEAAMEEYAAAYEAYEADLNAYESEYGTYKESSTWSDEEYENYITVYTKLIALAAQLDATESGTAEYEALAAEMQDLQDILDQSTLEEAVKNLAVVGTRLLVTSEALKSSEAQLNTTAETLGNSKAELDAAAETLASTKTQLDAAAETLAASKTQLVAAKETLADAKNELEDRQAQIDAGRAELDSAEAELVDAEAEIADGEAELTDAKQELADALAELRDGEAEIADAEAELLDGEQEYADAKLEADEEIADAEAEIADAKQELADMETGEWYVLDRQYISVYVDYGQNADRIGAIGEVFPAIFFLVAALVCLTTMTRMVEEERTQIGTLKALGYGKWDIAAKYIFYALSSSLLGSLLGMMVGQKLLPWIIINAYKILYTTLPHVLTPLSVRYSVMATGVAVVCTTGAAWAACYRELFAVPSELMRPAAPKVGKRVFLERISIIWKHLNFSQKAAVRNLFRYKKRFFMTIFGIGGSMALLLVGFGVKDSISYVGSGQYGSIFLYDSTITWEEDIGEEEKEELLALLAEDGRVTHYTQMLETSVDIEADGVEKSGYLVVPSDTETLDEYMILRNRTSGEEYGLDAGGIIISEKLASLLSVSEGDTVILEDDENGRVEAVIAHITENYFMHYIYMSAELYEELYGQTPEWNMIFTKNSGTDEEFEDTMQADYMEYDAVASVSFVTGTADYIHDMLKSMDMVVWVLVICAAMLAFIVLYNLNNINISERRRELATLKVLGFFDGEVSSYVNRENVLLTLAGIVAGMLIGTWLHSFVIQTAETDTLMFGRTVEPFSYVYSMLLTIAFAAIVAVVMHFQLKKIDMVESLKSVE
ncbi:MAG: FtsX-like permease family protein [Lachnospiraceae bacterium]|nr:FtsX-like permease family protein [Lachnospiraceae bacterium]